MTAPATPSADAADADRLDAAVRAVDAPDVVFALSRRGRRVVRCGGSGTAPPVARDCLRYEMGSASKTFTGLLLARLAHRGLLSGGDSALAYLAPGRPPGADPIRLAHLITHTSGLPGLPSGFYRQALPRWWTNPYEDYCGERVVEAFLRARPHHRPGARWYYSNFGVAVLGHALTAATRTPWADLMGDQVLGPLGLAGIGVLPGGPGTDAIGHRRDGVTATPPIAIGGFQAAGAVRATPHDLLGFLEAHLYPERTALSAALLLMRRPVLRRGAGRRHVHTLSWFRHATDHGPVYFHAGATSGQQAFLGFNPGTGTAVAAVATRRFRLGDGFTASAYALLCEGSAGVARHLDADRGAFGVDAGQPGRGQRGGA